MISHLAEIVIRLHCSGEGGESRARSIGYSVSSMVVLHVVAGVAATVSDLSATKRSSNLFQTHGTATARSEAPVLAVFPGNEARRVSMSWLSGSLGFVLQSTRPMDHGGIPLARIEARPAVHRSGEGRGEHACPEHPVAMEAGRPWQRGCCTADAQPLQKSFDRLEKIPDRSLARQEWGPTSRKRREGLLAAVRAENGRDCVVSWRQSATSARCRMQRWRVGGVDG